MNQAVVQKWIKFCLLSLCVLSVLFTSGAAQASRAGSQSLNGWFSILWGDSQQGEEITEYYLYTGDGKSIRLALDEVLVQPLGGILALNGKQVAVTGQQNMLGDGSALLQVSTIALVAASESENAKLASGSMPWITIMCKFNDVADEPKNLDYFKGMYSSSYPGLDHYWREVSDNRLNLVGSNAAGWYVLPQPRSYYSSISMVTDDCISAADANVDFSKYAGIGLMLNADTNPGGFAYGTQYVNMILDGVLRTWSVIWIPPWGYRTIAVISHEMGHGLGLRHSSGQYGKTYDNQWDVMSDVWSNCANSTDSTYGCLGQHPIAYHKDSLGWLPSSQRYVHAGDTSVVWLEQSALPQTSNYRMVKILIDHSLTHFYTVEVRRKTGLDVKLPGQAVIIHEVDPNSTGATVIDADGNGNTGDAGAMWTVGETFQDATNKISISVLEASATGFKVSITSPGPGPFSYISPGRGAVVTSTSPTLSWEVAKGATQYEYCTYVLLSIPCSNWVSVGTNTSVKLSGLLDNYTYYWMVRATNATGTIYSDSGNYSNFSVQLPVSLLSLRSLPLQDGDILESNETSGLGGTLTNTNAFSLGDDGQNRQYRAILSFNTFSLPDTAVITSATLKILKTGGFAGTNPFTTHGYLWADLAKPFGSSGALELMDFNAAATMGSVGTFGKTASSGWHSSKLISASLAQINRTGITQFRLRFALDDNNDAGADFVSFYSGNESVTANRPELVLEFYVP